MSLAACWRCLWRGFSYLPLAATSYVALLPCCTLQTSLKSRGFGILDVGFASQNVGFACGGSGSLYKTGGVVVKAKTWGRLVG